MRFGSVDIYPLDMLHTLLLMTWCTLADITASLCGWFDGAKLSVMVDKVIRTLVLSCSRALVLSMHVQCTLRIYPVVQYSGDEERMLQSYHNAAPSRQVVRDKRCTA